jgi:hypothetical protein
MVELTRRDALAALAATAGSVAGCVGTPASNVGAGTAETLSAAAEVVYPAAVEDPAAFVETYYAGRMADRPAYRAGVERAATDLDALARTWHDDVFADLPPETRESVLGASGADTAEPDPEGTGAGRIRYYVVNELLYALFTSPAGGRLVGTDNPLGHPGGIASYQRRPEP